MDSYPRIPLRSPRETLGGYIILARLMDKVRLHANGKLPPEYAAQLLKPGLTLDGRFLTFTGLEAEDLRKVVLTAKKDEEVLDWVNRHARPHSDEEKQAWAKEVETYRPTPERAKYRTENYPELAGKVDLASISVLDLIDRDEGRISPQK